MDEIQRRCRVLRGTYDVEELARCEEEWGFVEILRSMRSEQGFLSAFECLNDVIEADAAVLSDLGVKKDDLLMRLEALVLAFDATHDRGCVMARGNVMVGGQTFAVVRIESSGFQRSPFCVLEDTEADATWSVEYLVRNEALPEVQIKIGGDADHGVIDMIRTHGFFGGNGPEAAMAEADAVGLRDVDLTVNTYRIDPALAVAMFRGKWNVRAVDVATAALRCEQRVLRTELDDAKTQLEAAKEMLAEAKERGDEVEVDMAEGEVLLAKETIEWLTTTRLAGLDEQIAELGNVL